MATKKPDKNAKPAKPKSQGLFDMIVGEVMWVAKEALLPVPDTLLEKGKKKPKK